MAKSTTNAFPKVDKITPAQFKEAILRHLNATHGTDINKADHRSWWNATTSALNEFVYHGLSQTQRTYYESDTRAVHYFSLEFLMGRLTGNNLHNLGLFTIAKKALEELDQDLVEILDEEEDMALGNGGLGRLAACFIDSLATMHLPAGGYGIHYEHGLFRQEFQQGHQIERPDSWREYGNPFEICRPECIQEVPLYGYVETKFDEHGHVVKEWHPGRIIKGVPWDVPVVGYE